ncbi:MAG: DUF1836 domain-containing protein [Lachnospiraceae bacterium]|nr:DUF1836 domain-containing protein [Lachnospiraceae bacterium]
MTIDKDDLLNSILASIDRIHNVSSDEIPNVNLYMDQLTTLMDGLLAHSTRNPGEDKILTKTMINNYAKNDLLPPPDKKKYSREHILMLIFIYYSKGIMSITDIHTMLKPLCDRYFHSDGPVNLCSIYDEVFSMEGERTEDLKKNLSTMFERAQKTFEDCSEEDREILQRFAFIFMLGYDVYTKRLLIEKLLDEFGDVSSPE